MEIHGKEVTCNHCGHPELYKQKKGPHVGLYCKKCNKWIQWVKQNNNPPPKKPTYQSPWWQQNPNITPYKKKNSYEQKETTTYEKKFNTFVPKTDGINKNRVPLPKRLPLKEFMKIQMMLEQLKGEYRVKSRERQPDEHKNVSSEKLEELDKILETQLQTVEDIIKRINKL